MGCGVGPRHGSDLVVLWFRMAAATPIWHLAWEPPHAMGVALKKKRPKNKKKKNTCTNMISSDGCSSILILSVLALTSLGPLPCRPRLAFSWHFLLRGCLSSKFHGNFSDWVGAFFGQGCIETIATCRKTGEWRKHFILCIFNYLNEIILHKKYV